MNDRAREQQFQANEFRVYFDGHEWVAECGYIEGRGTTPVTAMMHGEALARKRLRGVTR